jgi:hypothetical protein
MEHYRLSFRSNLRDNQEFTQLTYGWAGDRVRTKPGRLEDRKWGGWAGPERGNVQASLRNCQDGIPGMKDFAFALFVNGESYLTDSLKSALHEMGISTWNCRTCKEFADLLDQTRPQLVFSDKDLADGTWLRVAKLVMDASFPAALFVVGDEPNARLGDLIRECGGYGYLTPPLEREKFQAAVRSAVEHVHGRKCSLAEIAA